MFIIAIKNRKDKCDKYLIELLNRVDSFRWWRVSKDLKNWVSFLCGYFVIDRSFQAERRASANVLRQECSWHILGKAGKLTWLEKCEKEKSEKEWSDKDKWELGHVEPHGLSGLWFIHWVKWESSVALRTE